MVQRLYLITVSLVISRGCYPVCVHEYGTHWSFVSDVLYSMPAGGFYRGRYRHPGHCCERFRELYFKHVSSSADSSNAEKISSSGSGKALLKVTEDHVHMLLDVVSELPDTELLLQKHFTAVLSSVWRAKFRFDRRQNFSSRNGLYTSTLFCSASGIKQRRLTEKMSSAVLSQSIDLVAMALNDVNRRNQEEPPIRSSQQEVAAEVDLLDLILEFPKSLVESATSLPPVINVSIHGPDSQQLEEKPQGQTLLPESSCGTAENRFRLASEACLEGEYPGWAASAFPICDIARSRCNSKSQSLGKHKSVSDTAKPPKSKALRIAEASEDSSSINKLALPPPKPAPIFECPGNFHFESDELSPATDSPFPETSTFETVPHEYDPNFIADLQEMDSLPEIIDIG